MGSRSGASSFMRLRACRHRQDADPVSNTHYCSTTSLWLSMTFADEGMGRGVLKSNAVVQAVGSAPANHFLMATISLDELGHSHGASFPVPSNIDCIRNVTIDNFCYSPHRTKGFDATPLMLPFPLRSQCPPRSVVASSMIPSRKPQDESTHLDRLPSSSIMIQSDWSVGSSTLRRIRQRRK